MSKQYAYGCISTVKIGFNDTKAIKNTKIYQDTLNTVKMLDVPLSESDIYIDVITASYRTRKKLNYILENAKDDDIIIVVDISALGFTKNEIINNYKRIFERGVGLLIPDSSSKNNLSSYSTVDFMFNRLVENTKCELNRLCEMMKDITITTRQGRKKEILSLPEHFEEVYWAFENFFIDEKTTLSNKYFNISKRRFYEFCEKYEKSQEYTTAQEEQDKMFGISQKPKRYGKVPITLSGLDSIMTKRFIIKHNGGKPNKSILASAAHEYKQEKIIENLQKSS